MQTTAQKLAETDDIAAAKCLCNYHDEYDETESGGDRDLYYFGDNSILVHCNDGRVYASSPARSLDELYQRMIDGDPAAFDGDDHTCNADWSTDLPTFGGDGPNDTRGIWSWDESRLLIGTCCNDLEIVARSRYAADQDEDGIKVRS